MEGYFYYSIHFKLLKLYHVQTYMHTHISKHILYCFKIINRSNCYYYIKHMHILLLEVFLILRNACQQCNKEIWFYFIFMVYFSSYIWNAHISILRRYRMSTKCYMFFFFIIILKLIKLLPSQIIRIWSYYYMTWLVLLTSKMETW